MKWLPGAAIAFLLVAGFPALCRAQLSEIPERRAIEGHVYYGDASHPATDIVVALRNNEDLSIDSQSTGMHGEFEFHGLAPGSYTLNVDLQGYERATVNVDVIMNSSKGNDISLRSLNGKAPANKSGSSVSVHYLAMPEEARDAYDSGRQKLFHDKDAEGAVKEFQKAVNIAPAFYEAYEQEGLAYLELSKPDDAEKVVMKSIEVSQDKYAPADFDLGSMEMNKRKFADGEKIVRHGLELDPNAWLGHYELGRALYYEKRVDDALKSAERAKQLQPNAAVTYRLLVLIHMSQHNNSAVLQDLDTYIKLDPDSPLGARAKQLREQYAHTSPASGQTSSN
jgi:tetratricopeptide (TPR) repeat protein